MVTLREVAKVAGVHPSVVSRVMNKDTTLTIKEETRERIHETVRKLNYRPNQTARNLKTNQTNIVGIVIPSHSNPVYSSIIQGAEDQAAKAGYNIIVYSMQKKDSEKTYITNLNDGVIDGLLIANSELDDAEIIKLNQANRPFILVNRFVQGVEQYVVLNDVEGAKLATTHLVDQGHTKIAHIAGPLYTATALNRFKGFREGLQQNNIPFVSEYVHESDYTVEGGYHAMTALLQLNTLPTAVFASNVMNCLGAMKAIHDAKLSIPNDVSIIGFHDVFFASSLHPSLTTVKMPLYEMGQTAITQLLTSIRTKKPIQEGHVIDGAILILRDSTGRPKK